MSLFSIQKNLILKIGNRKGNYKKFQNWMVIKFLITLVVIFLQVHLRDNQKEWIKLNQLDNCKVKILENLG